MERYNLKLSMLQYLVLYFSSVCVSVARCHTRILLTATRWQENTTSRRKKTLTLRLKNALNT